MVGIDDTFQISDTRLHESALQVANSKMEISPARAWNKKCQVRDMSTASSKSLEMETRMVSFGADILRISAKLPSTMDGKHIAAQILRSGTAAAANYGEARGAESRKDFIHKIRIVLKELNETAIWLQLISKSSLLPPEMISGVLAKNRELCRIMAASIKTARSALP